MFLAENIKAPLLVCYSGNSLNHRPGAKAELPISIGPPRIRGCRSASEPSGSIVESIKKRGGRVEYTVFQGEGHGWRKEENIRTALEKELAFYEDVFGLRK